MALMILWEIVIIVLLVGVVLLQIFLSKREGKWSGLILPILAFLYGLLYPLNFAVLAENSVGQVILHLLLLFLLGNIPTIILLVIYFACREKLRRKKQMEKIDILDMD